MIYLNHLMKGTYFLGVVGLTLTINGQGGIGKSRFF
jgi:hypothetical protein